MKIFLKFSFLAVAAVLLLAMPAATRAADNVYYDLGSGNKLYIHAEVCKINDCINQGAPSDWYNFSETSDNVAGNAGDGQTLVVKPGDSLTFQGSTYALGSTTINPVYGVSFTNGSYLTIDHRFTSGLDDIDGNSNAFQYLNDSNITLTTGLTTTGTPIEKGAITGTINPNVPDGTIITATFYIINPDAGFGAVYLGPEKALAAGDQYLRSSVQLSVSNPTSVAAAPAVLPKTGNDSSLQLPYLLLALSIIIAATEICVMKRAKK